MASITGAKQAVWGPRITVYSGLGCGEKSLTDDTVHNNTAPSSPLALMAAKYTELLADLAKFPYTGSFVAGTCTTEMIRDFIGKNTVLRAR